MTDPTPFEEQVRAALGDDRLFATLTVTEQGTLRVRDHLRDVKADLKAQRLQQAARAEETGDFSAHRQWLGRQAGFERLVDRRLRQAETAVTHASAARQRDLKKAALHAVESLTLAIHRHETDDSTTDDDLYAVLDAVQLDMGDHGVLTLRQCLTAGLITHRKADAA